jgi:hypothetical protein
LETGSFPLSDTRNDGASRDSPTGWDFQDINGWDVLDPNCWFVPGDNIRLIQIDRDTDTPMEPLAYKIHGNLVATLGNKEYLNICTYEPVVPAFLRGSGIVVHVNVIEQKNRAPKLRFNIIGCYKTHELALPEIHQDLVNELHDLWEARLGKERAIEDLQSGRLTAAKERKLEQLDNERSEIDKKARRINGLILDDRPRRVALHDPLVYWIDAGMDGKPLKMFGKPYRELHSGFLGPMADVMKYEDTPRFVHLELLNPTQGEAAVIRESDE